MRLSKSTFLAGLRCEKCLWLLAHDREKAAPPTKDAQWRMEEGTQVGIHARESFPGGFLIEARTWDDRINRTEAAISGRAPAIFEATFAADGVGVKADILKRNSDESWDLIEVKSSKSAKDQHYADLAIQKHVLERCDLRIKSAKLMHLNPNCRFPDLSNLFTIVDVTSEVRDVEQSIVEPLEHFRRVLGRAQEPAVDIGDHCLKPDCPFKAYCWKGIGDLTIFDIPYLKVERKAEFRERGIIYLRDIDSNCRLTDKQRQYVDLMLSNTIHIDKTAIGKKLSSLVCPLYFLDFETDSLPIPRFSGVGPLDHVPFQYSLHVIEHDGFVRHSEYLHTDTTDPRPALAQSLVDNIADAGSLIAWYMSVEKRALNHLADAAPEHSERLRAMAERLWDQAVIFRDDYLHPAFKGSWSLKAVLPVLVPGRRHADLAIQTGTDAQIEWNKMIRLEPGEEKDRIIKELREYCELDTRAMVEIHQVLQLL